MRTPRVPALLLACALAVVACVAGAVPAGATSSIAARTPTEILAASKAAMGSASSFRVHGSVRSSSSTLTLDLSLGRTMVTGTIVLNAGHLDIRRINGTGYLRGDTAFYEAVGANSSTASRVAGKWISAPITSSTFSSFSGFINKSQLLGQLYTPPGTVTKGHTKNVGGHPTIGLVDHSGSNGFGTLYVATKGKPYALEVASPTQGALYFTSFNKPVKPQKPTGAVSSTALGG